MSLNLPDNSELKDRLEILSTLPLDSAKKADVALVALGERPATSITIFYPAGEEARLILIEQKLVDAGLYVAHGREKILAKNDAISMEMYSAQNRFCTLYVAGSTQNVTELQELGEKHFYSDPPIQIPGEDHRRLGRLFGFPETAINAFISRENLLRQDLPEDIQSQDYAIFLNFAFSKDNWRQEIETPKRWYNALKKYAPTILKECVDERRKWLDWLTSRQTLDNPVHDFKPNAFERLRSFVKNIGKPSA